MPDFIPQLIRKEKEEERLAALSDTGMFWLLIIITLVLLAVAVHFLGNVPTDVGVIPGTSSSPSPTESHQPRVYTVSYKSGVFSPTNLRIHAGDTVRFRNDGILSIHIAADPQNNPLAGFDSVGDIPQGSYFAFTFAAKGIFGYINEKNPNETGTIIVR